MNTEIDLRSWLTKDETAAALNVSKKSVERWVARGRLEQRERREPGARPSPVYSPPHVAALAEELKKSSVLPALLPNHAPVVSQSAIEQTPALPVFDLERIAELMARFSRVVDKLSEPREQAVYVPLVEAVRISGLSPAIVKRLAREGRIATFRCRGVRYRRRDVEAL